MSTKMLLHFDGSTNDATTQYVFSQVGSGSLNYTSGKFSQGITNFDPYSRYLNLSLSQIQMSDLFENDFTIEFFHKNNGNGNWFALENTFGVQFSLGLTGANLTLNYGGSSSNYSWVGGIYDDGNFHHYALTKGGNDYKLYIDGVLRILLITSNTITPDTTHNFKLGYGFYASSVLDEFRHSDLVIYPSDFTPPSSPFILTTTPIIRAKQTVGDKWIISLFQDPTDGAGVNAPVGSIAQVDASGVASIWLKNGVLDSDWVKVNTGVSENGWNVAYSLASLDDVTADAYFGTNGTTFDGKIIFARHGNVMMEFNTSDQIKMSKNTLIDYASGKRISITDQNIHFIQDTGSYDFFIQVAGNEFQIDATGNLIVMRAMAIHERLDSANSFKNRFYNNHNGSNYEQMGHADNFTVSNVDTNLTLTRVYGDYSNNDIIHGVLTLVLRGTVDGNMGSVVFKKDYHVMNKQIIFDQDSFTSQDVNADVADLLISNFSYSSQTYTIALKTKKNSKTMQSTYAKVFVEEKVMNF